MDQTRDGARWPESQSVPAEQIEPADAKTFVEGGASIRDMPE
jgi:hypothetical protein